MRSDLVKKLKPLHGIAVENSALIGTPDVSYIGGWIECKWLRDWPKRASTPVTLQHPITKEQKLFIREHIKRGGTAWVMLRRRQEWFLFDGMVAIEHVGIATRQGLIDVAHTYWVNGLDANQLMQILSHDAEPRSVT